MPQARRRPAPCDALLADVARQLEIAPDLEASLAIDPRTITAPAARGLARRRHRPSGLACRRARRGGPGRADDGCGRVPQMSRSISPSRARARPLRPGGPSSISRCSWAPATSRSRSMPRGRAPAPIAPRRSTGSRSIISAPPACRPTRSPTAPARATSRASCCTAPPAATIWASGRVRSAGSRPMGCATR